MFLFQHICKDQWIKAALAPLLDNAKAQVQWRERNEDFVLLCRLTLPLWSPPLWWLLLVPWLFPNCRTQKQRRVPLSLRRMSRFLLGVYIWQFIFAISFHKMVLQSFSSFSTLCPKNTQRWTEHPGGCQQRSVCVHRAGCKHCCKPDSLSCHTWVHKQRSKLVWRNGGIPRANISGMVYELLTISQSLVGHRKEKLKKQGSGNALKQTASGWRFKLNKQRQGVKPLSTKSNQKQRSWTSSLERVSGMFRVRWPWQRNKTPRWRNEAEGKVR